MIYTFKHLLNRLLLITVITVSLDGCSILSEFQPSVSIHPIEPEEYVAQQRGDILATGELSAMTEQTIHVTGLDLNSCASTSVPACMAALSEASGISEERRLSTLAELWLQEAIRIAESPDSQLHPVASFGAWMEATRYAYAYLFFTSRAPGERALEDRQTQVRDWYNYSVQQAVTLLFKNRTEESGVINQRHSTVRIGNWTLHVKMKVRLPENASMPQELLPASSLSFKGLRSVYRRDGFGAELVAVLDNHPLEVTHSESRHENESRGRRGYRHRVPRWSEMPSPNLTVLFRFDSEDLEDLLQRQEVHVSVHDPLVESELRLHGERIPLAGNYTAGYGVWLARSGFNEQSLRSLLGRDRGIDRPHLYMMQPFDPDRRIILMLHGLASSPEAWVNVANEILGDEDLRRAFQIWQVYYPTNMPVVLNHAAIRRLFEDVLASVDPSGQTAASQGVVVIGHSMGGMISRLLVSSADEQLWNWALNVPNVDANGITSARDHIDPILRFEPLPEVGRVIFIAAPHRGTAVAGQRIVRWLSGLIRLPLTMLKNMGGAVQSAYAGPANVSELLKTIPTSIDNLDQQDPFVKAAATLPISRHVPYHSIIARLNAKGPLEKTDDGLVPYASSHLPGAASEKVIVSGHSVQETAAAILEIRRILHEDIEQHRQRP